MSKIAALIAVFALALTGSAFAQDHRSPDAKPPAVVTQDYRSPDARTPVPSAQAPALSQDLRSPDARPSGQFIPDVPTASPRASGSLDWGYLAGIVAGLILLAEWFVSQRRRRHGLAVGS
jgi:hypothetical protein